MEKVVAAPAGFVGQGLSAEAMAVVAGVVCGVLAGIPAAVLMLVAMRSRDRRGAQAPPALPPAQYPPVIVVGGVPPQQVPPARDAGVAVDGAWRELEESRRAFWVIGEE